MAPSPQTQEEVETELVKDEARFRLALRDHNIHGRVHDKLVAYYLEGDAADKFLDALLANDLHAATLLSDDSNTVDIRDYSRLMLDAMESASWGDRITVAAWKVGRGKRGEYERGLP